ncbi:MAG: two-component system response regulator [Nanoarchaeota archaeon]|nr:two-component system response regulator [Nanoarchaeota archaeon]|tara:strand:- start:228 stop:593 length:366 start_codon:yes stop_codon:yes gene_type:complete
MAKRILVVDDDGMLRNLIPKMINSLGYSTYTASNGQEALDLIEQNGSLPDLVLTDYDMPKMDGPQLRQRLLENERTKAIPVLCMSGDISKERRETVNADGYVQKPDVFIGLEPLLYHLLGE